MTRMVRPGVDYDTLELYKRKRRVACELKSCACGHGIEFGLRPVPSDGWALSLPEHNGTGTKQSVWGVEDERISESAYRHEDCRSFSQYSLLHLV